MLDKPGRSLVEFGSFKIHASGSKLMKRTGGMHRDNMGLNLKGVGLYFRHQPNIYCPLCGLFLAFL